MRIGIIVAPWIPIPPPAYGGIERVVDSLARGFAAAGHEVLLAASADSTCAVPLVSGMRPSEPAELGQSISELSHVVRSYEGLRGVDIIHDHTLTGPVYRHRPRGIPVVTTIHGPLTAAAVDLYRTISRDAKIIAISHDQASHAPEVPVARIIHHGMNVGGVPVGAGSGGYLCFVGRVCQDKGLLEAITIARKAGMPLRIAAKMRERDELQYFKEVIQPALSGNEEFLGELNDADKYRLMGEAVAFLNPIQWSEPFGLVMIESLATGTPVIATPIGSAPEIVEHGTTGFLGEAETLADFVSLAPELSRAACRRAVEERFNEQRMVADHVQLFTSILEDTPAAGVSDSSPVHQNHRRGVAVRTAGSAL